MSDALIDEAVSFARTQAEHIRNSIGTIESLAESKAANIMYNISQVLYDIAEMLERARCLAADNTMKTPGGLLSRFCSTWQLVTTGDRILLTRTKPATAISYEKSKLRLARHDLHITMELEPGRLRLCRYKLCEEINPANKEQVVAKIPELTYLLRFLLNATRKSRDALLLCARFNKPSCLAF